MTIGPRKSLYAKVDADGHAILVYEVYVTLTEQEMTPLDKDLAKSVDKINALLKERATLYAKIAALESRTIPTDEDSASVMSQFHDLMSTLPDAVGELPPVTGSGGGPVAGPTGPNQVVLR